MEFKHFIIPKEIKSVLDKDAKNGKIVVRFPPEPSGNLHIGHVKALYINACIAKKYKGDLIIRMDDTNPLLESDEYENAIIEDLGKLGIDINNVTHSSNYFDILMNYCTDLINKGMAYIDLTEVELMRKMRDTGECTEYRSKSVDDNLIKWNEMINGTLKTGCVRIKIDMEHKNKAMRDPTIFRPVDHSHHQTGDKYKVYPTYDFACPIVDVVEGITHVFRSTEFQERDDQYNFILPALGLKVPKLFHYGKLNIIGSELSKRKIKQKIKDGHYDGWDDPRLYTFRGLMKRGLHMQALEEFMKDTGYPGLANEVEPVALWALNKKVIDKLSGRFISLSTDMVQVEVKQGPNQVDQNFDLSGTKTVDLFHRNKDLGNKKVYYSTKILFDKTDYDSIVDGEEITLMSFGNAVFKSSNPVDGKDAYVETNVDGDVKKTEKKLLWLPWLPNSDKNNLVKILVTSFDNSDKKIITEYMGEPDIINVKVADYVQLLKRNYYLCTGNKDGIVEFIEVSK